MNHLMKNSMFDFLVLISKFLHVIKQSMNLHLIVDHDSIVQSEYFINNFLWQRDLLLVNVEHLLVNQRFVLMHVVELILVRLRILIDPKRKNDVHEKMLN
jgi:hypothetical protein